MDLQTPSSPAVLRDASDPVRRIASNSATDPASRAWRRLWREQAEREDAEAQYDRVRGEGYYTNLRILDVNERVAQPAAAEKPPKAAPKTAKAPVTPKPARTPVASKTARPQPAAQKAEKPESATKPPREPKPRAPAKAAKVKPTTAKGTKKKTGDSGSAASKKRSPKKSGK